MRAGTFEAEKDFLEAMRYASEEEHSPVANAAARSRKVEAWVDCRPQSPSRRPTKPMVPAMPNLDRNVSPAAYSDATAKLTSRRQKDAHVDSSMLLRTPPTRNAPLPRSDTRNDSTSVPAMSLLSTSEKHLSTISKSTAPFVVAREVDRTEPPRRGSTPQSPIHTTWASTSSKSSVPRVVNGSAPEESRQKKTLRLRTDTSPSTKHFTKTRHRVVTLENEDDSPPHLPPQHPPDSAVMSTGDIHSTARTPCPIQSPPFSLFSPTPPLKPSSSAPLPSTRTRPAMSTDSTTAVTELHWKREYEILYRAMQLQERRMRRLEAENAALRPQLRLYEERERQRQHNRELDGRVTDYDIPKKEIGCRENSYDYPDNRPTPRQSSHDSSHCYRDSKSHYWRASPGTRFVTELSQMLEIKGGDHADLASIMDRVYYSQETRVSKDQDLQYWS